jgi:arginyl-tRNA synthetase
MIDKAANEHIKQAIARAMKRKFSENDLSGCEVVVEKPKQKSFGDLSTPVALSIAKILRANPAVVAREIMSVFEWDEKFVEPDPDLSKTLIGGFINFRLSRTYLFAALQSVVSSPQSFGKHTPATARKMLFEFVSANPTGPMVVVNARAAAIGDVMARVNEWLGNSVEREFYVNDFGNQVELLGKSVACRYFEGKGEAGRTIPEGGYEGEYVKDLARQISSAHPEIEKLPETEIEQLFKTESLAIILQSQREILDTYGVHYNQWFKESQLHHSGAPAKVLALLREKDFTYKQDGAEWFVSSKFGDEKDRVLVRNDGTPTYFLSDLAYHVHKASRGFDESYTFWGPDHHGYIPRLESAVAALSLNRTTFRNFIIQQVNLIRDGEPFRMSKRKGDFITISDFLDVVGKDAARYFFLMRKLSTHFDFDMSLATKQSDENPVFYVQYAHARTCSLIKHALERGFTANDISTASVDSLVEPEELDVIKIIADFPLVLVDVAKFVEPHRIAAYLEGLSASFHRFYQIHRIVTDDRKCSLARLLLVMGVRNTINSGLSLMGVSAPERM